MENPELKTSQEWNRLGDVSITVVDPDGWDRSNFNYSYYEELITFDEYQNRLLNSSLIIGAKKTGPFADMR
jgi:hypothetical protein